MLAAGGGEGGEDQAASRGHAGSGQSAHQPSKRELSNQQLGRSLVLADLSQRHSPRSARARQGLLTGRRCGAAWAGQAYRKRCGLRILAAGAAAPDGPPASCTGTASEACARRCAQNWRRTCQSASEQGSIIRHEPAAAAGAPAAAPLRCAGPPTRCVWRGIGAGSTTLSPAESFNARSEVVSFTL